MLFIGDKLLSNYLEADEKLKLKEFIGKKVFTVSDTPLTYRQVNALDGDKLLKDDRKKKENWRRFSIKEMVYILIIHELKKFGVKQENMRGIWQAFFKKPSK